MDFVVVILSNIGYTDQALGQRATSGDEQGRRQDGAIFQSRHSGIGHRTASLA